MHAAEPCVVPLSVVLALHPVRPAIDRPDREESPAMTCTCTVEHRAPNAAPDAPYFPGIRRFPSTWIVAVNPDCLEHGYMTHPDFHPAADLRYGD